MNHDTTPAAETAEDKLREALERAQVEKRIAPALAYVERMNRQKP